jgi:hypothetical protein
VATREVPRAIYRMFSGDQTNIRDWRRNELKEFEFVSCAGCWYNLKASYIDQHYLGIFKKDEKLFLVDQFFRCKDSGNDREQSQQVLCQVPDDVIKLIKTYFERDEKCKV